MPLVKCHECGSDISDKASTCPKCGAPNEAYNELVRREQDAAATKARLRDELMRREQEEAAAKYRRREAFLSPYNDALTAAQNRLYHLTKVETGHLDSPKESASTGCANSLIILVFGLPLLLIVVIVLAVSEKLGPVLSFVLFVLFLFLVFKIAMKYRKKRKVASARDEISKCNIALSDAARKWDDERGNVG